MSQRARPESYFGGRSRVLTQEPVLVETEPQPIIVNTTALVVILAIVSVIALVGLFAFLASDKKCKC